MVVKIKSVLAHKEISSVWSIFPKENIKRVEHVPTKNIKRVEHVHIIKKVVVELNSFINAYLLVNDFLCSLNGLKEQFIIAYVILMFFKI